MSACPELKGSRVRDPLLLRSENRNKERFVEHEINIGISDENLMELHVRVLSGSRKWESQLGSASWKCKLEVQVGIELCPVLSESLCLGGAYGIHSCYRPEITPCWYTCVQIGYVGYVGMTTGQFLLSSVVRCAQRRKICYPMVAHKQTTVHCSVGCHTQALQAYASADNR